MINFLNVCKTLFTLGLGLTSLGCTTVGQTVQPVLQQPEQEIVAPLSEGDLGGEGRGIFAIVVLDMDGANGNITTVAKNTFTLFSANVPVTLELYYSYTYEEDYHNMTLAGRTITSDLDMGQSISVTASTGGETRYWFARARYKLDGGEWRYLSAGPFSYDANGTILN